MSSSEIDAGDSVHPGKPVIVDRYTVGARINHWVTAVRFVVLALFVPPPYSPSPCFFPPLFWGGELSRINPPLIGVVLFFSFMGLFFRFFRLNLWNKTDSVWLSRLREVLAGDEEKLPEVGKYNAGQKVVFWSMSFLILILIVSGLVSWDEYFASYFTIEQRRKAVLVHSGAAIVAICVWIVHVYAGIWVRGTISAMTKGQVTGGWAWRHHRKWLKDLVTTKR